MGAARGKWSVLHILYRATYIFKMTILQGCLREEWQDMCTGGPVPLLHTRMPLNAMAVISVW